MHVLVHGDQTLLISVTPCMGLSSMMQGVGQDRVDEGSLRNCM